MPVYVTTDSILHAWHRSFDAWLVEMETTSLVNQLNSLLVSGWSHCHARLACSPVVSDIDKEHRALVEVELYIAVALRLLPGENTGGGDFVNDAQGATISAAFDQYASERVEPMWSAVQACEMKVIDVLGHARSVDFSLFTPRGHCTQSTHLEQYFRAMT